MAGAPDWVCKTHNTEDCKKKKDYARQLGGGAGSRKSAVSDLKKEMRSLSKKMKMLKGESREYRTSRKRSSSSSKCSRKKRRRDSFSDSSNSSSDDDSVSSSGTNTSY